MDWRSSGGDNVRRRVLAFGVAMQLVAVRVWPHEDVQYAHVDVYNCEARNKLQKMDALDLYNRGHLIDIRVAKPARKSSEVCAMGSIVE